MSFEVRRASVLEGESWAQAATRISAARDALAGPVSAVDLSGDPLLFETISSGSAGPDLRIGVRPLTRGDFPELARWIATPHVARWWDERGDLEAVEAHYGPALDGLDPTRMWIWEVNGRSVGFVQDYRIADHPEWALLSGHPEAVGFDYAIGEAAFVGAGMGTRLLWHFLRETVVPSYAGVRELFAAPDHRNARSLRVLDKLGASRGVWFDEPGSGGTTSTVIGCSIDVAKVIGTSQVTGR